MSSGTAISGPQAADSFIDHLLALLVPGANIQKAVKADPRLKTIKGATIRGANVHVECGNCRHFSPRLTPLDVSAALELLADAGSIGAYFID